MKNLTYKLTLTAILSALSTIAFTIENLFPPLFIPGAKMGISNVFILFAIIVIGYKYGYCVLIVKILLGSIFSGNFSSVMYSLPAGIISTTAEILLVYFVTKISTVSISVLGATLNITVQSLVFCIITGSFEYVIYLPYLVAISVMAGTVTGLITYFIIRKLPQKFFVDDITTNQEELF